jgi:hypothetical protein
MARGDGLWWLLAMVLVVGHAMVYVVQVRGNEEKRSIKMIFLSRGGPVLGSSRGTEKLSILTSFHVSCCNDSLSRMINLLGLRTSGVFGPLAANLRTQVAATTVVAACSLQRGGRRSQSTVTVNAAQGQTPNTQRPPAYLVSPITESSLIAASTPTQNGRAKSIDHLDLRSSPPPPLHHCHSIVNCQQMSSTISSLVRPHIAITICHQPPQKIMSKQTAPPDAV